ncbi:MAG: tetratricopeptide repeat protein [Myxococcota bacterium]|nr:tetratricopeptide repeat protein [Myxococcota bacterium]
MNKTLLQSLCLWLLVGCRQEIQDWKQDVVPPFRAVKTHVPVQPTPPVPVRERPNVVATNTPPAMVPQDPRTYLPIPEGPVDLEKIAEKQQPAPSPIQARRSPTDEASAWLLDASQIGPGCLLEGTIPDLSLPSPAALEYLIRTRPEGFDGTSREALLCLLGVPRATGAEVYGKSAFGRWVVQGEFGIGEGGRAFTAFITPISTNAPVGEGTLYLVLDEKSTGWTVHASHYIEWEGDSESRRLHRLSEVALTSYKHRVLRLTQADANRSTVHFIELTPSQQLIEVFSAVTKDAAAGRTSTVRILGKGMPKKIAVRTLVTPQENTDTRYEITTYRVGESHQYRPEKVASGPLNLDTVEQLVETQEYDHVGWMLEQLPKQIRRSARSYIVQAKMSNQRKRYKAAMRDWKRATRAHDATPEAFRDYGYYLVSRKRYRTGVRALRKYLKLSPNAPDIAAVRAKIEAVRR